ncbi:efflux RND transporter periplasmic adaptor subunit [Guyparkeria sp. 1SP6A2]|nr:efflux RND transporter periplasmic adaptor subunit [Guyparkeria sp. 1SP6A2]
MSIRTTPLRITRIGLLGTALLAPATVLVAMPITTAMAAASQSSVTRYTCPMHPQIVEDAPGTCPICGMDLVEKEYAGASTDAQAGEDPHAGHDHAQAAASSDETVTRFTCPMHPQIVEDEPGSCPICGMDLVEKEFPAESTDAQTEQASHVGQASASNDETVTRFTCPMHPQIVEDEPGTCPICGMDLVEKEYPAEEVTQDAGSARPQPATFPSVSVDPITVQHMNVVIAEATRRSLATEIRTVGTVGYDEDLLAHVHPRTEGWVERLRVASVGASVEKGDVLFEYYSPDIVAAQQDYLVALRRGMTDLIESTRARLELLNVPRSTIDRVRQRGQVERSIPLLAPQDGYVAAINLREGMYIQPGLELYTIARRDRVWVNVDVLERRMQSVGVGQTARMQVDGVPGRVFEGEVDFVYPELDPQSRTLRVRLVFDNEDGMLRPNQFAEVTLSAANAPEVLTVPSTAIIPAPGGARVVTRTGEGRFRPVAVKTGTEAGGYTEILSGLEEGEQVVASGQFLIDSESNVQAAFARLSGSSKGSEKAMDDGQAAGDQPGHQQ